MYTEWSKSHLILHVNRLFLVSSDLCATLYKQRSFCNVLRFEEVENRMYLIPVPLTGDSYEPSPFSPSHWNQLPILSEQSNLSEGLLWHAPSCDWVFLPVTRLVFSDPVPTSKVGRIKTDEGNRMCNELHVTPRLLIFWKEVLLIFQPFAIVLKLNSELTNETHFVKSLHILFIYLFTYYAVVSFSQYRSVSGAQKCPKNLESTSKL
jgi:hypothetical protein